ncbi:MAG: lipopolysaccharide heptosyltransferase I [Acidobacteriia bacterium]|nr:lipopolysaccharide heptosyltransferase I [Terriglobia bacterium]
MKILIVKLGSIGDVIHAMPAVVRLRRAFPAARLDWLVERYARPVLNHAQAIDGIFEIDTLRWRKSYFSLETWQEILLTLEKLRGIHYDVVFDLQGLWKSAVLAFFSNSREIIGGDRNSLREPHASIFYSRRVDRNQERGNVIFEHLKLVDPFILSRRDSEETAPMDPAKPKELEFDRLFGEAEQDWVEEQLTRQQWKDFAIVNPGANWKSKRWPVEKYAQLSRRLSDELDWPVVITVGPSEKGMGEEILTHLTGQPAIMLSPTLPQFAALAGRARLFVGPDTGPLHIAAATRTPIVGIYASTDPVRNGPYSPDDIVVQQNQCGRYCYRRDCGSRRCIAAIPVAAVFEAVQARLLRASSISSKLPGPGNP